MASVTLMSCVFGAYTGVVVGCTDAMAVVLTARAHGNSIEGRRLYAQWIGRGGWDESVKTEAETTRLKLERQIMDKDTKPRPHSRNMWAWRIRQWKQRLNNASSEGIPVMVIRVGKICMVGAGAFAVAIQTRHVPAPKGIAAPAPMAALMMFVVAGCSVATVVLGARGR